MKLKLLEGKWFGVSLWINVYFQQQSVNTLRMINKLGFLAAYLLLTITTLFSQSKQELNQYGDSLYRQLQQVNDQEEKTHALLDLSFFWSDYDSTKAFGYIKEAEALLGKNSNTPYYQGIVNFYRAAINFDVDPVKAKEQYMEAERYLKEVNDERKVQATHYRARLWGSYGALLQREGKPHEYVEVLLGKVIPMAKQIKDSTVMGNNYQNVAMALMNLQKYTTAGHYYKEALALLQGRKDADEQRFTLFVNTARNALYSKEYTESRALLDSAARIANLIPTSS